MVVVVLAILSLLGLRLTFRHPFRHRFEATGGGSYGKSGSRSFESRHRYRQQPHRERDGGAKENTEQLKERVKDRAADLKRKAEDTIQDMGARGRSAADEQKNVAAERVGGVAHALRVASDELRDQGQPMVAEYSRHVAEGLESMAQSLSRRSVDDLVGGIEDFARQRPVAFIGGAMVAGFALARFMKSSAGRRSERTRLTKGPTRRQVVRPRRRPQAAPCRPPRRHVRQRRRVWARRNRPRGARTRELKKEPPDATH